MDNFELNSNNEETTNLNNGENAIEAISENTGEGISENVNENPGESAGENAIEVISRNTNGSTSESGNTDNSGEVQDMGSFYTESHKKHKNKKGGIVFQLIAASLISSIIGGGVVGSYFHFFAPSANAAAKGYSSSSQSNNTASAGNNAGLFSNVSTNSTEFLVTQIADGVSPSVVGIKTTGSVQSIFGTVQGVGEGSGIIYSADGYIVTNYHVIESAVNTATKKVAAGASIQVILPNEKDKLYDAQVVGYDSKTDLAVIKIDAANLPAAEFGDSDGLKVGELAVAIGNPGGLEYMGSVTTGIISGLNRSIATDTGKQLKLIQTDAAINPGNSGGPLVNSKGQVIGINSVKIAAEGYEGIGFAIPINTVKDIVSNLIDYTYVKGRPLLGVSVDERFNEQVAQQNNLPVGLYVQDVAFLSGAYKAGIKTGDIITKFDGKAVKSYDDLDTIKNQHKPGDTVAVEIYRDGQTQTLQVTLTEDQNN